MGFNVTQGNQFRFNEGTDGEIARIGPAGIDAKQGGLRVGGTTVIDSSRNKVICIRMFPPFHHFISRNL